MISSCVGHSASIYSLSFSVVVILFHVIMLVDKFYNNNNNIIYASTGCPSDWLVTQSCCVTDCVQLDYLELKLAELRRKNHDHQSALQQTEKTIESDAALVQARLEEQLKLQRQLETSLNSTSQFQRSFSFDSEVRSKSKYMILLCNGVIC